jgi:RNA polymerase sigma-70 factor, ECF subfamily
MATPRRRSLYMNRPDDGNHRQARFDALLGELRPDVYRFAFWLSRDRSIAEDVVQETMLRAWRAMGDLKDPRALRHWLLTIARREHARLYERKRLELVGLDELTGADVTSLATRDEEQTEDLRRALLQLEDDYREPLVLQVLLGYTTAEIAEHMGLNTGAVLTRLFRARNRLRKLFSAGDDAEPADEVAR